MNGERYTPPTIVIHDAGAGERLVRELRAGAEEEGVPVEVRSPETSEGTGRSANTDPEPAELVRLAHAAAAGSRLEVGVALDQHGAIAVHHATLPLMSPPLTLATPTPSDARRAGRTAARIVKRLPLR